MSLIESLIIQQKFEPALVQVENVNLILKCKVFTPDPDHPTQLIPRERDIPIQSNRTVPDLISKVKSELKNCSFGEDTFIRFQHRLYKDGKLEDIGIISNQTIEVISLDTEKEATRNEGFIFAFWSLVPLMVSISFIIPSLIGTFDIVYRGLFMLVGTLIGLPASVFLLIGITETLTVSMRISFVNYTWFGPCCDCSCCDCCCECCHCSECCCDCNQLDVKEESDKGTKSRSNKNGIEEQDVNLLNSQQENQQVEYP